MSEDNILQMVLVTVIQVLLPIVLTILAAWIKEQWALTRARIPAEQLELASSLAYQFVLAAEQNGLTQAIDEAGSQKKDWVLGRLQEELLSRGVKLDVKVLSDLIEAAVFNAFTQYK